MLACPPLYNECSTQGFTQPIVTQPSVPVQVDFGDCKTDEAGCFPIEGARPVSTIMTRYVTRALKQWRSKQEQARLLQKHQHKAAHPGLGGSLQRRKKAFTDKLSHSVKHVRLRVDGSRSGLVIV